MARAHYQRQQARRAAARAKARRRSQVIASALASLAVIGGVVWVAQATGGAPSPTASAPASAVPSATPGPVQATPATSCTYTREQAGGGKLEKFVGLPPAKPVTGTWTARLGTNRGPVSLRLDAAKAPCAVSSFVYLARRGYFDTTRCHRLLVGSQGILQCGDPTATGRGGPGYSFADENLAGATYSRGTLAMANAGPDTNGSQFFLVFKDSGFQPDYTPFGSITGGLAVLDKVGRGGVTGAQADTPKVKLVIDSVSVAPA